MQRLSFIDEFWRASLSYISEFGNQIARMYGTLEREFKALKAD